MPTAKVGPKIPNAVTRTLICVNESESSDYSGVLYNPYLPEPVSFCHIKELLSQLEHFFDDIAYPQPYFATRTFLDAKAGDRQHSPPATPKRCCGDEVFNQHHGELATFELSVYARQNASWQGSLGWLEGCQNQKFGSALEMIKLIDSAVRFGSFETVL